MKLQFRLEYHTKWGEDIRLTLLSTDGKGLVNEQICPMSTTDGNVWTTEVMLNDPSIQYFEYEYAVYENDEAVRREWDTVPRRYAADMSLNFFFPDHWRDVPQQSWLYSSAFTECISPRPVSEDKTPYFRRTLVLHVQAPQLLPGQIVGVLGNQPVLGDWNPQRVLPMRNVGLHDWSISLSMDGLAMPIEYKYVVMDEGSRRLVEWENGDNRVVYGMEVKDKDVLVVTDPEIRVNTIRWKGAGVVIPVFSLRSSGSQGVGDFGDLQRLVDWAVSDKLHVIQILPINDTTISHTWRDSYPYNCISVYAIHPQYIDLRKLNKLKDRTAMAVFRRKTQELNSKAKVDYEAVNKLKMDYLRLLYEQDGGKVLSSKGFTAFFSENSQWLVPYSAFCFLRDRYNTSNFNDWPQYAAFKRQEIETLCAPESGNFKELAFFYFVQYLLHLQLQEVSGYARRNGVILKGDIPIGINRYSVETWVAPFYFNMDGSAGAPPDYFSENGQNWGFPTYNWDAMAKDGYQWWVRRLRHMAKYFDAYRIDHVLGFFRIWEIPVDAVYGLTGQFSPSLPMSAEEIEAYGLKFRGDLFTKPYITDRVVDNLFGESATLVKSHYLNMIGYNNYALKPEYDTQRKLKEVFRGKDDKQSLAILEGLYRLLSDVLFVPDRRKEGMFHPRIAAQKDFIYQTLNNNEKSAFDRLSSDYFFSRHNQFWYDGAMRKLPVIVGATRMLVCAEDLGMVPECVSWVMNDLRILTLEIQTMPKDYGVEFSDLQKNPYRSVATITTHDMDTMRAWWENDAERAQRFYTHILQKDGKAPRVMPGWVCEEVVSRHLFSPSMLCLISLQDWMAMDEDVRRPKPSEERINVPSDTHNNWNYRMHLPLEELMRKKDLNQKIRFLVERSGRG
jgi:4-alpha-glucanotransferase